MPSHALARLSGRSDHPSRCERVAVDPDVPHILEFLRQEVLLGTIRVVPEGRRLVILPSSRWFAPGEPPRPSSD